MATPCEMVTILQTALEQNANVKQVVVDGQTITFNDRPTMLKELDYWQSKCSRSKGKRKLFRGMDLGTL